MSPCFHGEHPVDLAFASAQRGPGALAQGGDGGNGGGRGGSGGGGGARGAVEWRSLDIRVPLEAMVPSDLPLLLRSPPPSPSSSTAHPPVFGLSAALELIDPSDKTCLQRLEQILGRKPKVWRI